ncbi:hypothetical protein POM88_027102 [Heracleum sosnowskyi]|uniref:Pre-mRNA polyadenylation factor Fip1 domain-containing protein n=1 Tax=Heracleum sosnowskyi TaxID=360622 RepID=A0AAD8MQP1_9APIA|nr:hypothetical protein POM88_027102 [Heracleum sosnowskyi]
MDSTDDDFGDLYADVEVAASSAINGVLEASNSPAKDEKDEIFKSPRCSDDEFDENVSDSEDDFDIVLNDDDCDGLDISRLRNVDEEANEGKEVGEEAKDGSDRSRMCLDNLESGDRRNVAKVVNSQYKYMRPQSSTVASTTKSSKCEGPATYSCPSLKGEQEDNGLYHGMRPKAQGQSIHQFSLPRSRTIVDVNIDAFDEKPWRHPGADITDYFNFDFDEDSWKNYCNHLDRYRHGDISPARVTSDFPKHNGFHQRRTDHETIAHSSAEITRKGGRMFCKSESPSKEQEYSYMHKGRAIQVAGSITERRSSMDTRWQSDRDSDVVIQIDVQESKEPCTLKEQVVPVNCSKQGAYENGTSGVDDMDGLTFGSSSEDDLDNESLVGDAFDEGSVMPNSERCSVRKHSLEEAALGDSEENIKNVETLNKIKEEASRSTSNTAPTILEAEFPHNECYQYSRSPSFSGSDHEDYRNGAHHHVEKSYRYVRSPAPNSLTGYQKAVPPVHHHSKNFRSHSGRIKYRDSKDAARYGQPVHQEKDSLYGVYGSKSYTSGYKGTSNSVTDRDYDHYFEHDQSRQKDKLYGYSGCHEDEFLYYKETDFSVNFCDEKFPDYQIEDECTKYPRKKGYQRLKVPVNQFLPRNSDERAYRLRDDMLERDWDHRENSYTVDHRESSYLSYPENEIDTRWKRKGGEPEFTRRLQNDIEFFPEPKYLHDSSQQKYKRTDPYDARGRSNYFYEYEERLPYTRSGAKSPARSSRKCMEDKDDFWRSSHRRSFNSRPNRGAHTLKSSWHSTLSPKSDTYEINERQEIYEKHIWTERSQDIDIFGGNTETLNREKDVGDYDDRAYSSIRRCHRQSELLHWNEDEGLLMEQNDNYHAETASFSCKRTLWNKRFNAEDRTGHARNVTYDMQVDNLNCKWMSERDMGKQGHRSFDMYYGGGHDQALLRCGDSVDLHLVHGDEKSRGRSSAAGSVMFTGRHNNKACHPVDEQQSMFTELGETRTKMARQVKNPDLKITHKDVNFPSGISDTLQKALDIEEGQILTDDIMEDAMKSNISVTGNLSQTKEVKRLPEENATKVNMSNPQILEVIAKMEKRRERFKEPITLKDKLPEPLPVSAEDASGTMKQQRPARKRRWGGQQVS